MADHDVVPHLRRADDVSRCGPDDAQLLARDSDTHRLVLAHRCDQPRRRVVVSGRRPNAQHATLAGSVGDDALDGRRIDPADLCAHLPLLLAGEWYEVVVEQLGVAELPRALFVAVMGAPNYTYAEVTATQRSADWIASHVRLVEFFGGTPRAFIPDQLKSGVVLASRYEPGIQRTYEEWSQHYSTTILPARPIKPRDKAKVEGGVLIAQRWILARLRNITCFSIDEMNEHIGRLVTDLNYRVMKRYGKSRRELFDDLDRPAITALPTDRFIHGDWSKAQVRLDYHVPADHHDYSVPYQRATDDVEIRLSASTVEVFYKGKRCASHVRSFEYGGTTTNPEHLPASHRKYLVESDASFETWAETVGPRTLELVRVILIERPHPEHGLRSCRGLKSLLRVYAPERLEAACERALVAGARSYTNVESILKCGLDRQPLPETVQSDAPPPSLDHENIRGADYYN